MSAPAGLQISFTGGDDISADPADPTSVAATGVASAAATPPPAAIPTPAIVPAAAPSPNGLTPFEEVAVASTAIKISGQTAVDTEGGVELGMDDRIRVVGEFRVTKVVFEQNSNGEVVRVQYVKPISDLQLCPWDSRDPNDNGIVRLRGPR